eukprot:7227589-Karenia_brevis.AAC.1
MEGSEDGELDVSVVHWSILKDKPLQRAGFVVAVEDGDEAKGSVKGRIRCLMHVGPNRFARNMTKCVIVHPDVGFRIVRAPKKDMPVLPQPIQDLLEMWRQAQTSALEAQAERSQEGNEILEYGTSALSQCALCGGGNPTGQTARTELRKC